MKLQEMGSCSSVRYSVRNGKGSRRSKSWHDHGPMITDMITNHIIVEGVTAAEWELDHIVNFHKLERKNYRELKLLGQILKIERIVVKLIRQQLEIDEIQFGFMPECGTTNAIFILRQLQEIHLAKKRNFYFAFIDLEKVFDQVPTAAFWRACRKLGIEEWLVKIVKLMYRNAQSINE